MVVFVWYAAVVTLNTYRPVCNDSSAAYLLLQWSVCNDSLRRLSLQNNYDSASSYDSYSRFSNMHDDLKARSMPPRDLSDPAVSPGGLAGRGHDPYRYTRSTAQPLSPAGERGHRWVARDVHPPHVDTALPPAPLSAHCVVHTTPRTGRPPPPLLYVCLPACLCPGSPHRLPDCAPAPVRSGFVRLRVGGCVG